MICIALRIFDCSIKSEKLGRFPSITADFDRTHRNPYCPDCLFWCVSPDHNPYFGTGDEEDRRENHAAWAETRALWKTEFGEPLTGPSHRCSSKDCR